MASLPMGHWGTCPLEFYKFCAFCICCQLNCEILKIAKEKPVLHFRLSCKKHAKTHVNRLKQFRNPKNPGQMGRGKNLCCAPSPHFLATPLKEGVMIQVYFMNHSLSSLPPK